MKWGITMNRGIKQLSDAEIANLKIAIQRMVQRGSSQSEIADTLGIGYSTVLAIESNGNINN